MKKFVNYIVRLILIGEIFKGEKSQSVYLLPFATLITITSSIIGSLLFLLTRVMHLHVADVRSNFLPIGLFLIFAIPISIVLYYRRTINLDEIREKVNDINIGELKKERIKGIVVVLLCFFSQLIALAIMSILIKFNIL
jgi:hypothetical protein